MPGWRGIGGLRTFFLHDDSRARNDRLLEVFYSLLLVICEFPTTLVRLYPHEEVEQRGGAGFCSS